MKKLCLFLMLFSFLLTGCEVVPFVGPIVTGVVMWNEGEARKYYNEEPHTLYRSTKLALADLKLPIMKDEPARDGGHYLVAGDDDRFKINIRTVKPHITEVRVRVNFMGDKPFAELLYKHIDEHTNTIEFDDQGRPTKRKSQDG